MHVFRSIIMYKMSGHKFIFSRMCQTKIAQFTDPEYCLTGMQKKACFHIAQC